MSRRRHQQSTTKLDLKLIHQIVSSDTCHQEIIGALSSSASANDDNTFENSLQAIEASTRPTSNVSAIALRNHIIHAARHAKDDVQKWKLLILTILHKRFHMKAPEAKSIKRELDQSKKEKDDRAVTTGHGERMSFYISFLTLYYLSTIPINDDHHDTTSSIREYSSKACSCLSRLAVNAGGTRDLCSIIEHLVYASLLKNGIIDIHNNSGKKRAISEATVQTLQSSLSSPILDDLIKNAAELLDTDFQLIQDGMNEEKEGDKDMQSTGSLQSTINTFIPHHDRGVDVRRLTQSVAELMIWNATTHSSTDAKFTDAIKAISSIPSSSGTSGDSSSTAITASATTTTIDDKVVSSLHTIQTSIRRFRKVLNESSRKQGFSLCSSYSMDPSSIKLSMVKRGREGDVSSLQKIARKKRDNKTMKLIANRSADPSKAIPITSVRTLCKSWIPLESGVKSDDEMMDLDLKIQEATVQATIELLRKKVKWEESGLDVVLASLDGKVESDCAAILVASALNPELQWDDDNKMKEEVLDKDKVRVSLFLGIENKECTITSKDDAMSLLNEVCTRRRNSNNGAAVVTTSTTPATTKDIQNFIERHLEPNSHLILMTSADVKIEQRVLTDLQTNKNTIHCHMIDDYEYRMNREKAKVGDITITLAWDDECDLDLHCICPNGDHIYYGKREGGGVIGGGYLDVDMNASSPYSKEPVENIFFGDVEKGTEAAKGKYKVYVQNFAYHGSSSHGAEIPWRVRVVMNNESQEYTGVCKGRGDSSNVTVVEFDYEGRKAPVPEKVGTAMDSSNLVSVTSSTGDTIDSISGLLSVVTDHEELAVVEELVRSEPASEEAAADDDDDGNDAVMEDAEGEEKTNNAVRIRPLMAEKKVFDITNRDRLYLTLSKLPKLFHVEVNRCFSGSMSLVEFTASNLAQRLIKDKISIEELKKAGYHEDIVSVVVEKMQTFGL